MDMYRMIILGVCVVLAAMLMGFAVLGVESEATREMEVQEAGQAPDGKDRGMEPLTAAEAAVIVNKGTEPPFKGQYWDFFEPGAYRCRQCGAWLYRSEDKFSSHCGWPSFDDELPGAVLRQRDADGRRVEIVCAQCKGHLGHVFVGEKLTEKNTRHCVNSISMVFVPESELEKAVFAGGCFWGVEHLMQQVEGVVDVVSGYAGGKDTGQAPSYKEVCSGTTAYVEAVEVLYDPKVVAYETIARRFFEIHDPTQLDRQGPDMGKQYRSVAFYANEAQRTVLEKLIALLRKNGYDVVTEVTPRTTFYRAEAYHQNYILRHPQRGCHLPVDRFNTAV